MNDFKKHIGDLPQGWKWDRLSNLASVNFSNVDKHTNEGEIEVKLCNYINVYSNHEIYADMDFMHATATLQEVNKFQLEAGDILATKDSESPDDIAIPGYVYETFPNLICGYHLAQIRTNYTRLFPKYLYWLYECKNFRGQFEAQAVGVTRFGLSQFAFKSSTIPLPPLHEQKRISALLDKSCAAIDAAIAAKEGQIEALRKEFTSKVEALILGEDVPGKRKGIDKDWIQSIPSHWKAVAIKRVLQRMDYGISESTQDEGRFPVLKMGHIEDGEIRFEKLDFVESVDEALILDAGDILYNRTNSADQVGKAAIVRFGKSEGITFASYLVRLRTNHPIGPEYLNFVLNSQGFLGFARKLAIPSVQQSNLNSTRYGRLMIPLPSIEEQEAIITHLMQEKTVIGELIATITSQIATLREYRKSLIHECVMGQRRV